MQLHRSSLNFPRIFHALTLIDTSQGNERWLEQLESKFLPEFTKATKQPWVTLNKGDVSGWVRSAGGDGFTAGNITYVQVHAAGYVPIPLLRLCPSLTRPPSAIWSLSTSPTRHSYVLLYLLPP